MRELQIPLSANASLDATLGNAVLTREWQIKGLPTDSVSTESAILAMEGKRWPLMIDPQGQANKWIRGIQRAANLDITRMNDINLLRSVEGCIRVRSV